MNLFANRAISHQGEMEDEPRLSRARIVRTQLSDRGIYGPGGGRSMLIQAPREYRGSSVQVCGLWPFVTGAAAPMIGVPVGLVTTDGAPFCCDPISWFQDAHLIHNPSGFLLGKPGLGKSTLLRRMVLGAVAYGQLPLILGDLRPDFVDLIEALDGQVIRLGRGRGFLNILDIAEDLAAARRLEQTGHVDEAREVRTDAAGRRVTLLEGLIAVARREEVSDRERQILVAALTLLDRHDETPLLADVLKVIEQRPAELSQAALDRDDPDRYRDITENLCVSLRGLLGHGRLGEIFSQPTTTRMRTDRPVVFDISAVDDSDRALQAAALLSCWAVGFGMIRTQQVLAECGLEPLRHYLAVTDELWRVLRVGDFMVDLYDVVSRLNRAIGVGTLSCTHTMSDLEALSTDQARQKAKGFVERAGFVITGGLPAKEMELLSPVVAMNSAEIEYVVGLQDPPAYTRGRAAAEPPGRGYFLAKIGGRPGIPFRTVLTPGELAVNDTNKLWHKRSRLEQTEGQAA